MANYLLSDDDLQYIIEMAFCDGVTWLREDQQNNAAQAVDISIIKYRQYVKDLDLNNNEKSS